MKTTITISIAATIIIILAYCIGVSDSSVYMAEITEDNYSIKLSNDADFGIFDAYRNGELVGTIEYTREESGLITNVVHARIGETPYRVTSRIYPDFNGSWHRIEISNTYENVVVIRSGLEVVEKVGDHVSSRKIEMDSMLYEDCIPSLLTDIIGRYDMSSGGIQEFSLYTPASDIDVIRIKFMGTKTFIISDREPSLNEYQLTFTETTKTALTDETGKLVMVTVPAENSICVRRGYENILR